MDLREKLCSGGQPPCSAPAAASMLCYSWDSREYLNDQWEPHVFVVGVMYRSMRYEYIAGHHISYICLMAAHRKKDD